MLSKSQKAFRIVLIQICTFGPEENDQTSKMTNREKYVLYYTLILIAFMYFPTFPSMEELCNASFHTTLLEKSAKSKENYFQEFICLFVYCMQIRSSILGKMKQNGSFTSFLCKIVPFERNWEYYVGYMSVQAMLQNAL